MTARVQTILVLGMHRSGTSMVTRLITDLGVNLPNTGDLVVEPIPPYERLLEPRLLVELNDRLIWAAARGDWSTPPLPCVDWDSVDLATRYRTRFRRILDRHQRRRPWVWKDPRLCLTTPFWFPMLAPDVAVVFAFRDPRAVAESLRSRNGLELEMGLALWEAYTVAALDGTRGIRTLVIDYNALVDKPETVGNIISDWMIDLGVITRARATRSVQDAVDPRLRHFRGREAASEVLTIEQRELATMLRSMAGEEVPVGVDELTPVSAASCELIDARRRARREYLSRHHSMLIRTGRWIEFRMIEALKRAAPALQRPR